MGVHQRCRKGTAKATNHTVITSFIHGFLFYLDLGFKNCWIVIRFWNLLMIYFIFLIFNFFVTVFSSTDTVEGYRHFRFTDKHFV